MRLFPCVALVIALGGGAVGDALCAPARPEKDTVATPESHALDFLAREVPAWPAKNKCYSCHNNGDAARALYTAHRLGHALPAKTLDDTTTFLLRPEQWDHNGPEGPYVDKQLARVQFAAALVDAVEAGLAKEKALKRAAELVAEYQQKDGSWQVDVTATVGSPVTYGAALATYQARRVLAKADAKHYEAAIGKADDWLLKRQVKSVMDAAVSLLAFPSPVAKPPPRPSPDSGEGKGGGQPGSASQHKESLALIRKGQSQDGGWGPYVTSPPEAFDTALVLLALSRHKDEPEVRAVIQRGRAYLISTQQSDGSWPETTRPSGAESYAQRLSTSGWATQALLATRENKE